jgi:hypothetical protein
VAGSPTEKDGNGYISRLDADGKVLEKKWVTGLNAPKGTAVRGSALYVTDIDDLVEIHIPTRQERSRFATLDNSARFLDDVAVFADEEAIAFQDEHPEVYVSDSVTNKIWRMAGGALAIWYERPNTLAGPNGLVIVEDKLIVTELGAAAGSGGLRQIDIETKELTAFAAAGEIGPLDGIEANGRGGVTVTDGRRGRLLELMPGQPLLEIGTIEPGSADHEWVPELKLFVIPNPQTGEVVAYTLRE